MEFRTCEIERIKISLIFFYDVSTSKEETEETHSDPKEKKEE